MNEKNGSFQSNFILIAVFLIAQLLFLTHMFSFAFIIMLFTIVAAILFTEKQRLFIWTSFCYFVGIFAFIYGDRLLLLFHPLSKTDILIISRFLLLLPILLMSYVIVKFKKPIIHFTLRPDWQKQIAFPFIWWGFKTTTIRSYFIFLLAMIILIPFVTGVTLYEMDIERIVKIILFAVVNGIFVEFIWRGILLSQLNELVGEKLAALIASLSCAFFYHFIGLSTFESSLIFLFGIFFGGLTLKSNSIVLPMFLQIIYTITLIIQRYIPI